jgi:hypothetical protein
MPFDVPIQYCKVLFSVQRFKGKKLTKRLGVDQRFQTGLGPLGTGF